MNSRYDWITKEMSELAERSLERSLPLITPDSEQSGKTIWIQGEKLLNLSSNNYLGIAGHPRLIEAAKQATQQWGTGATASRLVVGNYSLYHQVEEQLAAWKGREAALIFPNGYMANVAAITSLVGRGDAVFSDKLNHASIVDGIILSRADHYRYRHNDMEHLEHLLQKHGNARRKLIVTDSIFSMDGDHAPILELTRLRDQYDALLMVDEAHGSGVYGEQGEGLCHALGVHEQVDVLMGTCSKAFGTYGAYICADHILIRYLLNKSRPLIYTTGLPPATVATIGEALRIIREEPERREQLRRNGDFFRHALTDAGFTLGTGDSPIIPVYVGENQHALEFSRQLREAGIAAVAIRPPTVPAGTARIRFSVMATHTIEELDWAIGEIARIGRELGVITS
ncbi:8-amino-7-oxononanoate synthase [Brevibacillus dissolubilis]|uniref:8-amino-7-oxononanoate synthase n=1 Tax=Brevibacillus dissolubilis TaxID=1844116 RepID=UPI001115C1B8|nr:8-amino-7-oxononanoate synthase [Brevibacillus dissolubilis]